MITHDLKLEFDDVDEPYLHNGVQHDNDVPGNPYSSYKEVSPSLVIIVCHKTFQNVSKDS